MKKIYAFLMVLSVFALISVSYAQTGWHTKTTITGSESQTTTYIAIPTGEWRIVWSITPLADYPEYAVFGAFVYPKGETALFVESISADSDTKSGTTYIHQGEKEYYIKIIAGNVQGYSLKVEYYQETASTPTPGGGGNTTGSNALYGALGLIVIIGVVVLLIWILLKRRKKPQVAQYSQPQTATPPPPPLAAVSQADLGGDVKARLNKLRELLDNNLITREEYEKSRKEILSQV